MGIFSHNTEENCMNQKDKNTKTKELPPLPTLPHGEGNFSYLKDSSVKNNIRLRKRINGKYVDVYGDSTKTCLRKMKAKEQSILERAKHFHPSDVSCVVLLQEAIKTWLVTYKMPALKSRSYDTIESTFESHILDTSLGRTAIENVSSEDIQRHINSIASEKSFSTTKKTFSLLSQFFEYYYARDINNNPMLLVKLPKKKVEFTDDDLTDSEELIVLNDEEIELLTRELSKPPESGKIGYKCGHMLLFVMWSYMRIGEVIALQYKNIDFDDNSIKIYKSFSKIKDRSDSKTTNFKWELSDPKTYSGRRKIYLYEKATYHLRKHIELCCPDASDNDFLFMSEYGNPLGTQYLNSTLHKALDRCGINKKVSVHGLRHTGISYFIRHGVPVEVISKLAGHSDTNTTNRIYYSIIEQQKKDVYKNLTA